MKNADIKYNYMAMPSRLPPQCIAEVMSKVKTVNINSKIRLR